MPAVKVKDLRVGDRIKAFFLNDDQWHFVRNIGPGLSASKIYLAVEGYGKIQLDKDTEVEKQN